VCLYVYKTCEKFGGPSFFQWKHSTWISSFTVIIQWIQVICAPNQSWSIHGKMVIFRLKLNLATVWSLPICAAISLSTQALQGIIFASRIISFLYQPLFPYYFCICMADSQAFYLRQINCMCYYSLHTAYSAESGGQSTPYAFCHVTPRELIVN